MEGCLQLAKAAKNEVVTADEALDVNESSDSTGKGGGQHEAGSVVGAAALVAGTTIGAGILALPAATQVRAEGIASRRVAALVCMAAFRVPALPTWPNPAVHNVKATSRITQGSGSCRAYGPSLCAVPSPIQAPVATAQHPLVRGSVTGQSSAVLA